MSALSDSPQYLIGLQLYPTFTGLTRWVLPMVLVGAAVANAAVYLATEPTPVIGALIVIAATKAIVAALLTMAILTALFAVLGVTFAFAVFLSTAILTQDVVDPEILDDAAWPRTCWLGPALVAVIWMLALWSVEKRRMTPTPV